MRYDRDTQLMLAFKRGDKKSFDILFKRYSVLLINYIYRFLGSRHKAEELAQEVLLKIYLAKDTYRPKAKFSTWVYRIATNACLNELRRHEYHHHSVSLDASGEENPVNRKVWMDDQAFTPEQSMEKRGFEEAFKEALKTLPERQKAAFLLNRFQNASYSEVAGALSCSVASVKSLIHRATVGLKDKLKDYII